MENNTRTMNSVRNIFFGVCGQVLNTILSFINRTVFINTLGVTYLGINGLFTNILTILSLAELGVSNAIIYSMYKPLAEKDDDKVKALMQLYRYIYRLIGCIVGIIGILIIPFLGNITKNTTDISNINIIYILFLANSVSTYFLAYKKSIIIADQKSYIDVLYRNIFNLLQVISQIVFIKITKSFIIYLIIQIICNVLNNIFISFKVNSIYPFLQNNKIAILDLDSKKQIISNIKSLITYKIGGVVLNGTDNIIISSLIGVSYVGLISNYNLIISSVNMLISQVFHSIVASVGNLNTENDIKKMEFIYNTINFTSFWLFGICSICLWILCDGFISIWIGNEYIMSNSIVLILVLNFYLVGMQNASWIYREALGLFKQTKYLPIISSIINIIISIILGKHIGIQGVFLATSISLLLTNIWYDPYILHKHIFKKSVIQYYYQYIKYIAIVGLTGIITNVVKNIIFPNNNILTLLGSTIICMVIPNIIFYILFKNKIEFKYLATKVLDVLKSKSILN